MFPLHKVPAGLLGLLNLKTLGRNPDTFSNVVGGVLDLRSQYGAALQLVTQASPGEVAATTNFSQVVPAGEIWRVLAAGIVMNFDLGFQLTSPSFEAAISIGKPDALVGATPVHHGSWILGGAASTVAFSLRMGKWFDEPPVLQGGHSIEANVMFTCAVVGTGVTPLLRVLAERVPL